jgi:glycine cleavage system H protein
MGEVPNDRRYTSEHEWARSEGQRVTVGITDYAQDQLGDIVFVSLPEPGVKVEAGQPLGEVESTKSVSDIYSPVSGTVVDRNGALEGTPELINEDPYGRGWLVVIEADAEQGSDLLDAGRYKQLIDEQ